MLISTIYVHIFLIMCMIVKAIFYITLDTYDYVINCYYS